MKMIMFLMSAATVMSSVLSTRGKRVVYVCMYIIITNFKLTRVIVVCNMPAD